jgi:hypothetical protein
LTGCGVGEGEGGKVASILSVQLIEKIPRKKHMKIKNPFLNKMKFWFLA